MNILTEDDIKDIIASEVGDDISTLQTNVSTLQGNIATITGNVDDTYVAKIKEIDGYEYVSKKGNTTGKITDEDTNVIYYYKAKTEKKQAKDELQSLPKTGGINYLFIISAVTIMGILFGYGYIKLKDIK